MVLENGYVQFIESFRFLNENLMSLVNSLADTDLVFTKHELATLEIFSEK